MIAAIHDSLRALIESADLVKDLQVDVSFDAPTDGWIASLTHPTVNFFLFDVCENTEKRDGAPQTSVSGRTAEVRLPPRRIDLTYMVSVIAGDVQDEHTLLWRVMKVLMQTAQLSVELPEHERPSGPWPPLSARILGRDEGRGALDLWNALGTEPHAAVGYVITAPMDLALTASGPLVLTRTARYRRPADRDANATVDTWTPPERGRLHIGGLVTTPTGAPVSGLSIVPSGRALGAVTSTAGEYVLRGLSPGEVTLRLVRGGRDVKTVVLSVPSTSYDIVLDG
jgi:hypothetical protein